MLITLPFNVSAFHLYREEETHTEYNNDSQNSRKGFKCVTFLHPFHTTPPK